MSLPRAAQPFVDFPILLRENSFAISPDQTMGFIEAVGLLGPRDLNDIRRAAIAMLAIPKEREDEFDALFRAFFYGQTVAAAATSSDEDDDVEVYEDRGRETEVEAEEEIIEAGALATAAERLGQRMLISDDTEVLRRFARLAPSRLPKRRSYRYAAARQGEALNMRKTLREAVRRDGEVVTLARRKRKMRPRRVVLLIDVSGSMKERTDDLLRFAHTLAQAAERFEAFTLGTRLTRITPALGVRNRERSLARVSGLIADIDGGTRIGDALQAFLSVPRFAGFARGAAVIILSDGLERGGPEAMVSSVRQLGRMAWRLDWLSPLAGSDEYRPDTEALAAVLPHLDSLSDGNRLSAICDHMLGLGRAA